MKTLLILMSCGVALIQGDVQLDEKITQHRAVCSKKTNVDPGLLEKARKGDFSDNPDFKKHVFCVSQEIGFQDGSGKVQHDVIKAKCLVIFHDRADELIEVCLSKNDDLVQVAVETFKCFYDKGGLVLL